MFKYLKTDLLSKTINCIIKSQPTLLSLTVGKMNVKPFLYNSTLHKHYFLTLNEAARFILTTGASVPLFPTRAARRCLTKLEAAVFKTVK